MTDTQFERFISALERIGITLEALHGQLDGLIATADDGGTYIRVETLEPEDDEDEE